MMNRPALLCLLMMIQSALLLQPIPFLLRLVVPVSALGQMRELVLVVHAKAKGRGEDGICAHCTRSLDWH